MCGWRGYGGRPEPKANPTRRGPPPAPQRRATPRPGPGFDPLSRPTVGGRPGAAAQGSGWKRRQGSSVLPPRPAPGDRYGCGRQGADHSTPVDVATRRSRTSARRWSVLPPSGSGGPAAQVPVPTAVRRERSYPDGQQSLSNRGVRRLRTFGSSGRVRDGILAEGAGLYQVPAAVAFARQVVSSRVNGRQNARGRM